MKNKQTHSQKANELFFQGYNCAQSVLGAYAEDLELDFETLIKLGSSFGGGMGRLREVCGAVSSMFMIAGLKKGYTIPGNDEVKQKHYELIQTLAHAYKEKNKSIICRELLELQESESSPVPEKRTEEYYKNRPCGMLIMSACDILDEILKL